jgi:hypothetical protein
MNSSRLREMLQLMTCTETHVMACNELPRQQPSVGWSCIVNSDVAERAGKHWYCLYVPKRNHLELFDSLNMPRKYKKNKYFRHFFKLFKTVDRNATGLIQSPFFSEMCGLMTLMYLYYRCNKNMDMYSILTKVFTKNIVENECRTWNFVSQLYEHNLFSHVNTVCPSVNY